MRKVVRRLLIAAAVMVLVGIVLLVVVHLPPVQRAAWQRVCETIAARTGFEVRADTVAVRLLPARFRATGLQVSAADETLASVEQVEVSWRWRRLLGAARRIERVEIVTPRVDLGRLPNQSAAQEEPGTDPGQLLQAFEVGELVLRGGDVLGAAADIQWSVGEIELAGAVERGRAELRLRAISAVASRADRPLDLGAVAVEVGADQGGIVLRTLSVHGEALEIQAADGYAGWQAGAASRARIEVDADVDRLLWWWDPAVQEAAAAAGRVMLSGSVGLEGGAPSVDLHHAGEPFVLAGFEVEQLLVKGVGGAYRAVVGGRGWGRAEATFAADGGAWVAVDLDRAPAGRLAVLLPAAIPAGVPPEMELSGRLSATLALPVALEEVEAEVDLRARWRDGEAAVKGWGGSQAFEVEQSMLRIPGGRIRAVGTVQPEGPVDLVVDLDLVDPGQVASEAARWWPPAADLKIGGGVVGGRMVVTGTMDRPEIAGSVRWTEPSLLGRRAKLAIAELSGDNRNLVWSMGIEVAPGCSLSAEGQTALPTLATNGTWELAVHDLGVATVLLTELSDLVLQGAIEGHGSMAWDGSRWQADLKGRASEVRVNEWSVDSLIVEADVDPDRLELRSLELLAMDASLTGTASLPLTGPDSAVSAEFVLSGLDPVLLPIDLPAAVSGPLSGTVVVSGTQARPTATAELSWQSGSSTGLVDSLELHAVLDEGVIDLSLPSVVTASGPLHLSGSLPLGQVPRPAWLWPDAVDGPLRLSVHGQRLRAAQLLAALGLTDTPQIEMVCDLDAEMAWDLDDPAQRFAEVRLGDARIESEIETLAAEGPVTVLLRDGRVELESVRMAGLRSHIVVAGTYDLESTEVQAQADLRLDPAVARLLPLAVKIHGPIAAKMEVRGPLAALDGRIDIDHRGGMLVMRDPALEVRDLVLRAEIEGGVVAIRDGSATVNRGSMQIGGGWDPVVGQGVVLELEGVALLLPGGILSRWSGDLAIEPHSERLATVVGDLRLEGGLWDRPFEYSSILLGGGDATASAENPLQEVGLDLEVSGRRGIAVDNNLGEFVVTWDLLHAGGTAANPVLQGRLEIAPGGRLTLPGAPITVSRGTVEFTGEPGAEPRIEIVPEETALGEDTGEGLDTTLIATKGLATGLGKALGLENETLQAAEIAVETETNPASRFAVGQRLSRNLALFITTDLSNVQDVQTMLQLWNIPGLKGLAVQGFQETEDDVLGGAVIERVRWGGSGGNKDIAVIHRVRMEGKWPISKRRLKKVGGVKKGKPYDPFLLFAAGVRMEQELAEHGYFDARVEAAAEGSELLPTLVFSCDPGPRREVVFSGDTPPKSVRRRVTGSYQPPPLERGALDAMATIMRRHWASEDYPDAEVEVAREGEHLVVHSQPGPRRRLEGPVVSGVPGDVAERLKLVLSSTAELDAAVDDPERAGRIVRRWLSNAGFNQVADVRVHEREIDDDRAQVMVEIDAGPRELISGIGIAGSDPLEVLDSQNLGLEEGAPLDRVRLDRAVFLIRRFYREAGYPDVEVATWVEQVAPLQSMVWVELVPGPQRHFTEVNFTGLRYIRESVLRKGLEVKEEGLVKPSEVDKSAVQISNFAPVERVSLTTVPSGSNGARLDIEVEEKPRWTVGLGARWRTDRGLEALVDVRDDNLFGRGLGLNLRGRWESAEQQWSLLTSLPPLPGGRFSTLFGLSYFEGESKEDPENLLEETVTGTLEANYLLSRGTTLRSYYKYSDTYIFEKEPDFFFPFEKYLVVATLGAQYVRDRLDDPFDARSGYYFAADVGWSSSIFGSDLDTLRTVLTGSLALEPRSGWTWSQSLRLGHANAIGSTTLDPELRFFAGGQASVRGFERDSVGPLDIRDDGSWIPQGGGLLVVLNEELRIPVWRELRLAVFADVGQVWEDWDTIDGDLAVGAGVGLRYATPIGPLWADIAWPVVNRGISSGYKFYVGIGRPF